MFERIFGAIATLLFGTIAVVACAALALVFMHLVYLFMLICAFIAVGYVAADVLLGERTLNEWLRQLKF